MIEMKGILQKIRENARDSTPDIAHSWADAPLGVFLQPRYVQAKTENQVITHG